MSAKTKYPRAAAVEVARQICDALKPLTERLICAGSLRRRKPEVGDIEIVYIAKLGEVGNGSELIPFTTQGNLVNQQLDHWLRFGVIRKRLNSQGVCTWGEQNKLAVAVASGIPIDFFEGNLENWWTLLVCRTGSAAHNEKICNAAVARGLRWDPYSGFRDRKSGRLLYVPKSERDVFTRVGLPYLEPWQR